MDRQAREAREAVKNMTFSEKLKHFWYYYKIPVIVALVIAALVGVTVWQIVSNEEYDLQIEYFGERLITEEQAAALEDYLKDYVTDIDGDGEVTVHVTRTGSISDMGAQGYAQMKFTTELAAGQYQIFVLDSALYESMLDSDSDGGTSKALTGQSVESTEEEPGFETLLIDSFDMRENEKCAELLGMSDQDAPTYWCLFEIPPNMADKPESQGKTQNAANATRAIFGE